MTEDRTTMDKKTANTASAASNEHIKKFKKNKGAEFKDSASKRKTDDAGGNKNFKKPRFDNQKSGQFNNKAGGFKHNNKSHGQQTLEKPDWNKVRLETKDRKKKRKQRNVGGEQLYDTFTRAIKLWEELRHNNCSKTRRLELCKEVAQLFSGVVQVWLKQASGIRMAEHLITYGDEQVRKTLFDEVSSKQQILEIMKDPHSQHFLQKMLKHGSKDQRQTIMSATEGQVVRLTKHSIAAQVIDLAYKEYATAAQRATMMQEFFGPHFRYFKEEGIKSLSDVLAKYPNKKEAVMKDLQNGLQAIMHKGIFNNSLIISLLREYLIYCDQAEKQTVIEALEDGLLPVIHERDGSRIAMLCLWNGTAKQRKTIIKSFKDHIMEVATWDHSYMVLLAAMDCIDDTKFLAKAVLDPLMKEMKQLLESPNGTKVLRYMALGRNPTYFHPDVLNVLKQGDGNPYSKKEAVTRRSEIVAHISKPLLDTILSNLEYWCRNPQWTLFLGPAIGALFTVEHKKSALESLAKHCAVPMPAEVNTLMDIAHSAKMINYIISKDVENKKNNMPIFSLLLLKHAHQNIVLWLSCNRGCFLCVRLIETGIGRVVVAVRNLVKPHLKLVNKMKATSKGAEILLQKLTDTEAVEESEDEAVEESEDKAVEESEDNAVEESEDKAVEESEDKAVEESEDEAVEESENEAMEQGSDEETEVNEGSDEENESSDEENDASDEENEASDEEAEDNDE